MPIGIALPGARAIPNRGATEQQCQAMGGARAWTAVPSHGGRFVGPILPGNSCSARSGSSHADHSTSSKAAKWMLAQIAQGSASPEWFDGLAGASGTLAAPAGSEDVRAAAVAFSKVATCRCPNDNAKWMTSAKSASPPPIRRLDRNQPIQAHPWLSPHQQA